MVGDGSMHDRVTEREGTAGGRRRAAEGGAASPVTNAHPPDELAATVLAMAGSAPVGILITSGAAFTVRYVNPAFRTFLRTSDDVVLGMSFTHAFPGHEARRAAVLLRRVYRTGNALCGVEMKVRSTARARSGGLELHAGADEDEEERSWRLTAWPLLDGRGRDAGQRVLLCIYDVDGRRRTAGGSHAMVDEMREINQRLLLASLREHELTRRAQEANEAKSTFLATMSHELRTPLTAILGYEELLAGGLSGPVTDTQLRHLTRIKSSAQHLLTIIDDILTFTHVDAARESPRHELVNASDLLVEAAALVLPMARARHLDLEIRAPEPPFTIDTDRDKVRQILVNIAANGIKFTERGEITLSARIVEGDAVEFEVRDTGIGIAPEDLERIFDPFWQVEQAATRKVGGTGLGLSVSQRLAHLLGGGVTVQSEEGKGSRFVLRLPLRVATA